MSDIKPILAVGVPRFMFDAGWDLNNANRYITQVGVGYNCIVYPLNDAEDKDDMKIEAFYPSNFSELEFKELKEKIEEHMKQPKEDGQDNVS